MTLNSGKNGVITTVSLPNTVKVATSVPDIYQGIYGGGILTLPCIVTERLCQSHYETVIFILKGRKRNISKILVSHHIVILRYSLEKKCNISRKI